ncbi:MAG: radical SAM family heme chaperone HemW [Muribaculaceae bacterium]|nr:radical SAM family heme chaperone HemW [Muribaculaceae bacterium]
MYIHIPMCARRCTYCDFYSTVGVGQADRYLDAVLAEARLRQHELGDAVSHITTIYIGGGTPSQLSVMQLAHLVQGLNETLPLAGVEEFTIEVNPDDVNQPYIEQLVRLGVNRISMGVQSFVDSELQAVGRRHTALQAERAVAAIRRAGITNVSIDLIYGLPGQMMDSWRLSVQKAIELHPQHISAYALSFEPGTVLWLQRERGEVQEADEDLSVAMYAYLTQALHDAGYEHYEISNFALPGRYSRHNSSYWNDTPYLGLGASAHSYDGAVRRYNPCDMMRYINSLENGQTCFEEEVLTPRERYDETVMVQLRTSCGIDVDAVRHRFGENAVAHLLQAARSYEEQGQLEQSDGRLRLTALGVMTSDAIIRDLMWE